MIMEPSPEYVRRHLQLADEALDDARYLLQDNRLKATANRAYYAMFYAAMAALLEAKLRTPKSHSGAIALFGEHYIVTGKINRQFGRNLRNAYNLRQQSDYEIFTNIGEDQVREATEKAEAFVAEVKRLLE